MGSFKYSKAITKHFAVLAVSLAIKTEIWGAPNTQIRQHATKDGERSRWLLVQLKKCCTRKTLQVLKRSRRWCRHFHDLRDLVPLCFEERAKLSKRKVKSWAETVRRAQRPLCAVPGMNATTANYRLCHSFSPQFNFQNDNSEICSIGKLSCTFIVSIQ